MATTAKTTSPAARIARAALACVLVVALGLPPLTPLRASAADGSAAAASADASAAGSADATFDDSAAFAPAQTSSIVPEGSNASAAASAAPAPAAASAPAQSIRVVPETSEYAPDGASAPAQITSVVPETSEYAAGSSSVPAGSNVQLAGPDSSASGDSGTSAGAGAPTDPEDPGTSADPAGPDAPGAGGATDSDPGATDPGAGGSGAAGSGAGPDADDPAASDAGSLEGADSAEGPDSADGPAPAAAALLPAPADDSPAPASANLHEGVWGGVAWTVDAAGLLRLAPAETPEAGYEPGQLPSKTLSQWAPWREKAADSITSLQVDTGVKAVGESVGLFKDLGKLGRVGQFLLDASQATDLSFMFENCEMLAGEVDLSACDTSQSTSMECLFHNCKKLERVNLTGLFSTAASTSLTWMFHSCEELVEIKGIASFDTSRVITTSGMFVGCKKFTTVDISGWDVSSAQNMKQMFLNCSALERLDLSQWNTKSAEDFFQFFRGCKALKSVSFGPSFTTVNVGQKWWQVPGDGGAYSYKAQGMAQMFFNCTSLVSIDLTPFDTTGVRNMEEMFSGCSSLTSIKVGDGFSWTGAWDPNNPDEENYGAFYFSYMLPGTTIADATFEGWRDEVNPDNLYLSGSSGALIPPGARTLRASFKVPEASTTIAKGTCGENNSVTWDIVPDAADSTTGQLRIYPTVSATVGKLPDMTSKDNVPWNSKASSITTAKVFPGVAANGKLAYMFEGCSNMTACDVSNLDTSAATGMQYMFEGCSGLASLDLSSFDTSSTTLMLRMFRGCSKLSSLDVSSFNTSRVTQMYRMFEGCSSLTSLDLTSFDTSSATIMDHLFEGCTSLASIKVGEKFSLSGKNITTDSLKATFPALSGAAPDAGDGIARTYSGKWFLKEQGAKGKGELYPAASVPATLADAGWDAMADGPTATWVAAAEAPVPTSPAVGDACGDGVLWDLIDGHLRIYPQVRDRVGKLPDMTWTSEVPWYSSRSSVTSAKVYPGVAASKGLSYMFYSCSSMLTCDVSGLDTSNATSMNSMFRYCRELETLDLSTFDTSKVTQMGFMFEECSKLSSLDLSSFDTSQVIAMISMFSGCSSLTSLNLSSFNTFKVESMSLMFSKCSSLTTLDLSSFNTSGALVMTSMFADCTNLKSIPGLEKFNAPLARDMGYMFFGCSSFTSLDLSKFETSQVTNMVGMFSGCSNLTSLDLSLFDTSMVTNMTDMFKNCSSLGSVRVGTKFSLVGGDITDDKRYRAFLPTLSGAVPDAGDGIERLFMGTWYLKELKAAGKGEVYYAPNVPPTLAEADWTEAGPATWKATQKVVVPVDAVVNGTFGGGVGWYVAADPEADPAADAAAPNRLVVYPVNGVRGEFTLSGGVPWASKADTLRRATVLSGCAVSAGGSLAGMFESCSSMLTCDVSGLDAFGARYMPNMFFDCSSLASLDLSGFDTSNVTHFNSMFLGCRSLESLDLSSFDTSKAIYMDTQFLNCSALSQLKLPDGYIGSNVQDAGFMFSGCSSLVELPANLAIPGTLPQNGRASMFYVDPPSGEGSKLATTYAGSDPGVFLYGFAADNRELNLTGVDATWEIGSPTASAVKASLFADGVFVVMAEGATQSFADASAVPWKDKLSAIKSVVFVEGVAPADLSHWFEGATALTEVSTLPASVTVLDSAFKGCTSLKASGPLPENLTSMAGAFEGCTALESAPATVPASVADMSRAFYGCTSLVKLASTFAFGADSSDTTDCFHVDAGASGALSDVRYEGSDTRVLGYDWVASNRRLVVGDMTGTVSISGDAMVGGTLTASITSAPEGATVSWRWVRVGTDGADDEVIAGATKETYTTTEADYGRTLKVEATAKKGNGIYTGSVSATTAKVAAPQVTVVVPEKLELSMDAAGKVSAAQMNIKNAGAYALEVTSLAPRLSDDAYPAGSWTLTGVPAASPDDTPVSLLSARPFLKAAEEAYPLSAPIVLAPNSALDLSWTATFAPEGADALASLIAKANDKLTYGAFEPIVAYKPPAAA